ncbi:MAG: type III polyketide synthase [Planctomycetes bacterium]|nr:type III polyketide synthase [Planctomycetota bacterium]
MTLAILGIGTAVPPATYDQSEGLVVAQMLCHTTEEQTTWLPNMYGQTGIDKRHICLGRTLVDDILDGTQNSQSPFLPKQTADDRGPTMTERMKVYREQAPLLARQAAARALEQAHTPASAITHLVTVSCTGFYAPGWDVTLVRQLGLPANTQRTHVGFMGCHGMLNGLRVARAFADADPRARVLTCATELCCLHYHYEWDPQKVIANAIFADGAAATVGVAGESASRSWKLAASGSYLVADSENVMTWSLSDHGFIMTLAKKVPDIICRQLRGFLEPWLAEHGLTIPEIRSWAIHPGGPKILDAAGEALGLAPSLLLPAREIFAEYGNMSSPTVLFIIERLQQRGHKPPCVALGFGPGLNIEVALFR